MFFEVSSSSSSRAELTLSVSITVQNRKDNTVWSGQFIPVYGLTSKSLKLFQFIIFLFLL